MNVSSCKWFPCCLLLAWLAIGDLALCGRAAAADTDAPSASSDAGATKADDVVKPYTGPPIYLDEPPVIAPPTLVERKTITDNYVSGKVHLEREIARYSDEHLEADGFYREYYESGQLFAEGQYRQSHRQGEWTFYNENGTVNRKVTYEKGLPNGQIEVRRPDGTLMAKRSFHNGRRTGEWIVYDDTGERPLREEHYSDGQTDGVWKAWYPSGQLLRQMTFKNGKRDGMATEWNKDGTKNAELSFVDGVLDGTSTFWLPDRRKLVRQYKQNRLLSETIE